MKLPLYLSRQEVEQLLSVSPDSLRKQLLYLLHQFDDQAEKLREITARTNANAHFEKLASQPKLKSYKLSVRMQKALDLLSPEQRSVLLRKLRKGD